MANFNTHLNVAAMGSGLLASMCLGAGLVNTHELIILCLAGTIGGILPDIDLDHATPTKLMFTMLGLVFAFLLILNQADSYSIVELWILWGVTFTIIRYPLWQFFNQYTHHRGLVHTLIAGFGFHFATVAICYEFFDYSSRFSWLCGSFILVGFLIHLSLDEFYSVDFMNKRLKRSFGTAMKIWDPKQKQGSGILLAVVVLIFLMTPDSSSFTDLWTDSQTWTRIGDQFFPEGMWFDF